MSIAYRDIPFRFRVAQFATDVRAATKELGLTLSDIDVLAGVSIGTTARIGRGETTNPQMNTWLPIANVLGLNALDYFELVD